MHIITKLPFKKKVKKRGIKYRRNLKHLEKINILNKKIKPK